MTQNMITVRYEHNGYTVRVVPFEPAQFFDGLRGKGLDVSCSGDPVPVVAVFPKDMHVFHEEVRQDVLRAIALNEDLPVWVDRNHSDRLLDRAEHNRLIADRTKAEREAAGRSA